MNAPASPPTDRKVFTCPFCGKPPAVIPSGDGTGTMIHCITDGCVNPSVSYYGRGVAVSKWNTRNGEIPALAAEFKQLNDRLEARQPPEPDGWQPIETAPRGKKLILGYPNRDGNWRTVVGRYVLPRTLELSDDDLDRLDLDIESGDDKCYAQEGWYETPDAEAYEFVDFCDEDPTHWMPLPLPPTKRDGA